MGPWNQYLGTIFHCLQYRARSSFDARKVMIQVNVDRIEHLWTLNGWFSYDDDDTNTDDDDSVNENDDNSTATLNSKYGNIDDDDFFHVSLQSEQKVKSNPFLAKRHLKQSRTLINLCRSSCINGSGNGDSNGRGEGEGIRTYPPQ